jgi:hypothetical protein
MFNENFFPTPDALAEKLTKHLTDKQYKEDTILEPSAGKGDLIDFMENKTSRYGKRQMNVLSIEQEPDLQAILREDGRAVIADDFLTFWPTMIIDHIVMNPPFDNGADHLLHAIEILEDNGGTVACILNAETIRNPHSEKRKLLANKLEKYKAEIEYVKDGFTKAERKTKVEVAIIHATIEGKEKINLDFDSTTTEKAKTVQFSEADFKDEVALNDKIGNAITRFEESQKALLEVHPRRAEARAIHQRRADRGNEQVGRHHQVRFKQPFCN